MCQLPLTANRTPTSANARRRPSEAVSGARPRNRQLRTAVDIGAQRFIPLADLLAVEIFVAAGVIAALMLGARGWVGGLSGLAVALILLFPVRGTTLSRSIALRWSFRRERHRKGGQAPADRTVRRSGARRSTDRIPLGRCDFADVDRHRRESAGNDGHGARHDRIG